MSNLLLLIAALVILNGVILYLHAQSTRVGFTAFMVCVGGLTALLELQLGLYIEPFAGVTMFLNPTILVPTLLVAILVVYVVNGAVPARLFIFSMLGVALLTVGILAFYELQLALPDIASFRAADLQDFPLSPNPRTLIASLAAFAVDMFVIAVFYQGVRNLATAWPEWLVVGVALLAGLWSDAVVFGLVSDFGTDAFWQHLPGDLAGKTMAALVVWPGTGWYLARIAPRRPDYVGGHARPTFDVFFGSFAEIRMALVRTEKALAESEVRRRQEAEYFQQITENINEALWLASPGQHNAYYVNAAYERLFGREAAQIYADPLAFINAIHPDDQARILTGLKAQADGQYNVEYRIVRPDGSVRWVRDRAFPIRNASGKVYRIAGITEDITEYKRMRQQEIELAVAREKVKMLRDFISDASHDLKAPLSSVNIKIYQLARAEDEALRRKYLDDLQALSSRLGNMINDLLTLARLDEMGGQGEDLLDLNRTIQGILAGLSPQIEAKALHVETHFDDALPPLNCDQIDIARALNNLIDNAVRYTPKAGRITIRTQHQGDEISIMVGDTGIGISEHDLKHIFDRFYRSDNASEADPAGTGLGLAIVRKIVEQHRGRVEVESALNVGTRFTVRLPLGTTEAAWPQAER